jgi:hypothetical protein
VNSETIYFNNLIFPNNFYSESDLSGGVNRTKSK